MSEVESKIEVQIEVEENDAPVVEEKEEEIVVVEEPSPVIVQKKKRPRSEKQTKALEQARKSKAAKRQVLKKPVKIERNSSESEVDTTFSWPKEVAKVSCLAALGLASVYVQQTFAQKQQQTTTQQQQPVEVALETQKKDERPIPTLKSQKPSSKDPFSGYR
jgi:hypothetical protein